MPKVRPKCFLSCYNTCLWTAGVKESVAIKLIRNVNRTVCRLVLTRRGVELQTFGCGRFISTRCVVTQSWSLLLHASAQHSHTSSHSPRTLSMCDVIVSVSSPDGGPQMPPASWVGVLTVICPTGANIYVDRSVLVDTVSCLQFVSKWDSYCVNNRLTSLSDVCLEIICQLLCVPRAAPAFIFKHVAYLHTHSRYDECIIDETSYSRDQENSEL
jgi:hypothetical protein